MSTREAAYATNQPVRGNITTGRDRILNVPRVSIYRTTNLTTTTAVPGAVNWDALDFDTEGLGSGTKITARTQGVYDFKATGTWDVSGAGYRQMYFLKNGVTTFCSSVIQPVAAAATTQLIVALIPMNANDYVEVVVNQTSGGNLIFFGTASGFKDNGFQACLVSLT